MALTLISSGCISPFQTLSRAPSVTVLQNLVPALLTMHSLQQSWGGIFLVALKAPHYFVSSQAEQSISLLPASPSRISLYTDSWLTVYFPWTHMFWKYFFFNCKYGWIEHMVETSLRFKLVTLEKTEEKLCHLCTIKNWNLAATQWQKKHLHAGWNPICLVCFLNEVKSSTETLTPALIRSTFCLTSQCLHPQVNQNLFWVRRGLANKK